MPSAKDRAPHGETQCASPRVARTLRRAGMSGRGTRGPLFWFRTAALFLSLVLFSAAEMSVPALTGRVVDRAGMLGGDAARVEQAILGLEQATGGQMAVLTMPTLGNDALESFSMRVAEAWKIGRKGKDNGAVLLVVRDSRKMRIEVGYGWEGKINDARAGDIIRGMGPYFRAGRFGDGCVYAVRQVETFVTGKPPAGAAPVAPVQGMRNDDFIHVGTMRFHPVLLFLVICIVLAVVSSLFSKRGGRTYGGSGYSGWSGGGFSSGGGGFSGGGGSFGGGGASGSW